MNAKELSKLPFEQFVSYVEEVINEDAPNHKKGISLKFPFDLRSSMGMKVQECSPWTKWTAFLNNAGTLCHVISSDAEILVRITFSYPIKHLSPGRQNEMITGKIKNWVIL